MLHLCLIILIFHFWTHSWFALLELSCPKHSVLPQGHTAAEQSGRFIQHVRITAFLFQGFIFCNSIAFLVHVQTDLLFLFPCPTTVLPVVLHPVFVEIIITKGQITLFWLQPCKSQATSLNWLHRHVGRTLQRKDF